jgi:hypothetical protein
MRPFIFRCPNTGARVCQVAARAPFAVPPPPPHDPSATALVKYRHKIAGEDSPTDTAAVKAVLQGACHTLDVAARKLAAATSEKTIAMATLVRPGLAGLQNRAILLLAFSLAARRSDLVTLDVEELEECP